MNQLTPFEKALLKQLEDLSRACEISLQQSKNVSQTLSDLSVNIGQRVEEIELRQKGLTAHLNDLAAVLSEQAEETTHLVNAVNKLLKEQTR